MTCCGTRGKLPTVRAEQKWEYINLDDFHSTSCWTPTSYIVLYISIIISVAVYVVDTYTAVNLLAFGRWSGQIKPQVPMKYSRWVFAGCIILSFVLLFLRWLRAIRVMRQGGVAQSYLDPLAVRVQSVRMGKEGRGWKRFLVFAELSKGKKGADYVALFTHYSFEAWLRILLAEAPRQVINALTLYSVMQLNLIPVGKQAPKDGQSPVAQFFVNVGLLVDKSGREQAVILFGMLFTLVIWVVTFINLMVAVVLYLLFLFHHIPSSDGGLTGYCRRKINKSVEGIVKTKVEKALRKENAIRARQEARQGPGVVKRQPTLPNLSAADENPPLLSRQTTLATLPGDRSRPGTSAANSWTSPSDLERQPTLPDLDAPDFRPGPPTRVGTNASSASWASHSSNTPLMGAACEMGYAPPGQVQSPGAVSSAGSYHSRPPPSRSHSGYTQSMQRSYTPGNSARADIGPGGRSTPGIYQMEPVSRSGTVTSGRQTPGYVPAPINPYGRRTPSEQHNPYFASASESSSWGSSVTLPRSNTPGNASMPSQNPRVPSSSRSIAETAPAYSRPDISQQPTLPRLNTNDSWGGDRYQSYTASTQSSAQSSFTPYTPYRSFTQPIGAADQYRQQTPDGSQLGHENQPRSRHEPPTQRPGTAPPTHQQRPTQRPGTAPPTSQQMTPVADEVMEDIMNGY